LILLTSLMKVLLRYLRLLKSNNMHIVSAIFHNYRGYKHTEIEFHSGLNIISGAGDAGKSALLKALRWVCRNESQGKFINTLVTTPAGKIKSKEEVYVSLVFSTGDVVKRYADSSSPHNYVLGHIDTSEEDWTYFYKVKEIPDEIQYILNMSDINIQKQFDPHFLLSRNGAEVARELNKMVHLEKIDSSTKKINSIVSSIKKDVENAAKDVEKFDNELSIYNYLPQMVKDIEEVEQLSDTVYNIECNINELTADVLAYNKIASLVDEYDSILYSKPLYEAYESLSSEVEELERELKENRLTALQTLQLKDEIKRMKARVEARQDIERVLLIEDEISDIQESLEIMKVGKTQCESLSTSISEYNKIIKMKPVLDAVVELGKETETLDNTIQTLTDSAYLYEEVEKDIEDGEGVLGKLKESISGICPTCGKPYNEGECC
jgi:AAA15 family ATPase/GTPase